MSSPIHPHGHRETGSFELARMQFPKGQDRMAIPLQQMTH